MDAAIIIALIALAGSVFSTLVTVFGAPALQARRNARRALEIYREPLLAAAYELQSRMYNILCRNFLATYVSDDQSGKRDAAIHTTLYVFAQFFGWREIIRREVQYLRFSRNRRTREIARLLREIEEAFLTDRWGRQLMIWRVEQRGIGDRMIQPVDGRMTCLGYASFIEQQSKMAEWLESLEHDLENLDTGGRERLTELQHLLLEVVKRLDQNRTRYPFRMETA
jgi:hypothetical protein